MTRLPEPRPDAAETAPAVTDAHHRGMPPTEVLPRRAVLQRAGAVVLGGWAGAPGSARAQIAHIGEAVNHSGRQRMLSQRMAKLKLAPAAAGVNAAALEEARTAFVGALGVLGAAPENDAALQEALALTQGQWTLYEPLLRRPGTPEGRDAADLFVASENLLSALDQMTALYARQSA